MTTTEFGVILATIWIAPHCPSWLGQITGMVVLGLTLAHEMGYL